MRLTKRRCLITLLLFGFLIAACKKESQKESEMEVNEIENDSVRTAKQSDGLILFTGKFVYLADAAVLQVGNNMYAVVINDKMHELDEMVKPFKKEVTDFVPVAIRGKLIPKPEEEEGWDYRIDIKEIIEVYKPTPKEDEVIKIGNQ